jgi:hypothetical protein
MPKSKFYNSTATKLDLRTLHANNSAGKVAVQAQAWETAHRPGECQKDFRNPLVAKASPVKEDESLQVDIAVLQAENDKLQDEARTSLVVVQEWKTKYLDITKCCDAQRAECDKMRDELEAARVSLRREAGVRERMKEASNRVKTGHADTIRKLEEKHTGEIQDLKKQIQEGHNLRSMLDRERDRICDLLREKEDLEALNADLQERQKGLKHGQMIRVCQLQHERISAELPALRDQRQSEQEILDSLRTQVNSVRAQISDLENHKKSLQGVEKKLGRASVLLEQKSIRIMQSTQECFICRCCETEGISISCSDCARNICLSCAEAGIMQALAANSAISNQKRAVQLCCLDTKCRGHLPANIQALFDDTTVRALNRTRLDLSAMAERVEAEKTKVEKLHQLSCLSAQAKAVHLERQIVQNMMDLRCPSCAAPFESFDGCCALACSRCHCQFCSWCLQESPNSDKNHSHVACCGKKPKNLPDALFVDQKVWRKFMNEQVKRTVISYIDNLDDSVKSELQNWAQPLLI